MVGWKSAIEWGLGTGPPWPVLMVGLAPVIHSFHWTRNSRFFNIAKDPRVSMRRRSGTLVIDFRSGGRPEEYEGEYQCFARNKFGTALSNRIRLQVSSECQGQVLVLAAQRVGGMQEALPSMGLSHPRKIPRKKTSRLVGASLPATMSTEGGERRGQLKMSVHCHKKLLLTFECHPACLLCCLPHFPIFPLLLSLPSSRCHPLQVTSADVSCTSPSSFSLQNLPCGPRKTWIPLWFKRVPP